VAADAGDSVTMAVDARGTVRLYCQSPAHPTGVHTPLGDVRDEPLRFVGTSARLPESPDGRVWLPCVNKHCRSWNCFEAVNGDGE
jgi:hypothetical protein